jgi:radical SAM protein with 4Fe4S-binding SPASM domain
MDCPQNLPLEDSSFYDRLHAAMAKRRIPFSGSLEVTFRCNLRCVHCYVGKQRSGTPNLQEMSTNEIYRILDQITEAGCLWLLLTGGEPLVRPDLLEIYSYARRKGLIVTLFTNGTLLTERIADALAEMPPFLTEITLYGNTQETYERVTGIPGSHARCLHGIDLLLKREIPLKLKTMVMRSNQHELKDMQDFAKRLGVGFRFDPLINAGLDGEGAPVSQRLSPKEVVKLDLSDPIRIKDWKDFADQHASIEPDNVNLYICGAGKNTFNIDPFGDMSPCIMSRSQTYNLREGSFHEGWFDFMENVRNQHLTKRRKCDTCRLMPICGQCPGWATLESGNAQQPVDYLCLVTHLRAEFIGLQA